MTTKRKTVPAKDHTDREQRVMDGLLATLWGKGVEELLQPQKPDPDDKRETNIAGFLDSLCDPELESQDPAEFEMQWTRFLHLSFAHTRCDLVKSGVPLERVKRLIVPGWACFDKEGGDVRFRFGPPLKDGKAVLVILVFRDAVWHPPAHVEAAVWRHPVLRSAVGKDEYLGWKGGVMQRLTWAASLADEEPSSQRLKELSDAITSMLHVSTHPDPIEEGWISTAIESQRFWAILAHAVDFGIYQNARRLFRDGKLLGAAQQAALNEKVEKLSWFLIIEEAIREKFAETGEIQTPSELRKLFGLDAAPGSEQVILEFPDPRFAQHGEINWGMFKKYAKHAGKIWSGHGTQ